MKRNFGVSLVVALLLAGAATWTIVDRLEAAAKPGEAVITYSDPALAAEGNVEFSHLAHKAAFGTEKLDCKPCHMKNPPGFSMKPRKEGESRPLMTMSEMAEGKWCGACHNGKTEVNGKVVFNANDKANCSRCHKK